HLRHRGHADLFGMPPHHVEPGRDRERVLDVVTLLETSVDAGTGREAVAHDVFGCDGNTAKRTEGGLPHAPLVDAKPDRAGGSRRWYARVDTTRNPRCRVPRCRRRTARDVNPSGAAAPRGARPRRCKTRPSPGPRRTCPSTR